MLAVLNILDTEIIVKVQPLLTYSHKNFRAVLEAWVRLTEMFIILKCSLY